MVPSTATMLAAALLAVTYIPSCMAQACNKMELVGDLGGTPQQVYNISPVPATTEAALQMCWDKCLEPTVISGMNCRSFVYQASTNRCFLKPSVPTAGNPIDENKTGLITGWCEDQEPESCVKEQLIGDLGGGPQIVHTLTPKPTVKQVGVDMCWDKCLDGSTMILGDPCLSFVYQHSTGRCFLKPFIPTDASPVNVAKTALTTGWCSSGGGTTPPTPPTPTTPPAPPAPPAGSCTKEQLVGDLSGGPQIIHMLIPQPTDKQVGVDMCWDKCLDSTTMIQGSPCLSLVYQHSSGRCFLKPFIPTDANPVNVAKKALTTAWCAEDPTDPPAPPAPQGMPPAPPAPQGMPPSPPAPQGMPPSPPAPQGVPPGPPAPQGDVPCDKMSASGDLFGTKVFVHAIKPRPATTALMLDACWTKCLSFRTYGAPCLSFVLDPATAKCQLMTITAGNPFFRVPKINPNKPNLVTGWCAPGTGPAYIPFQIPPSPPAAQACPTTLGGYTTLPGVSISHKYNIKITNQQAFGEPSAFGGAFHTDTAFDCYTVCCGVPNCAAAVYRNGDFFPGRKPRNCWLKSALPTSEDMAPLNLEPSLDTMIPSSLGFTKPAPVYREVTGKTFSYGTPQVIFTADMDECYGTCEESLQCFSAVFKNAAVGGQHECSLMTSEPTGVTNDAAYTILARYDWRDTNECGLPNFPNYKVAYRAQMDWNKAWILEIKYGENESQCWDRCLTKSACQSATYSAHERKCTMHSISVTNNGGANFWARNSQETVVLYPCTVPTKTTPAGNCPIKEPQHVGTQGSKPGLLKSCELLPCPEGIQVIMSYPQKDQLCGNEVQLHGTIYVKDHVTGDCDTCPNLRCNIRAPSNIEGDYRPDCSAEFTTDASGQYQMGSQIPGDEYLGAWGLDYRPHWHLECFGCGTDVFRKMYLGHGFNYGNAWQYDETAVTDANDRYDIMLF